MNSKIKKMISDLYVMSPRHQRAYGLFIFFNLITKGMYTLE